MVMFLILVSVVIVGLIVDHMYRKKLFRPMENIPIYNYRNFPVIGQAYKFLGDSEDRMLTLQQMGRDAITQSNGSAFINFCFGRRAVLVVTEPEVAELVLKTYMDKDDLMNLLRDFTGNGTIFAPGPLYMNPTYLTTTGQPDRSAMDRPRPGGTAFMITVSPTPVSIWRPRRKQIVHAFTPKMLQQFAEVFIQGSEQLVQHLRKNANKGAFSVWKYLTNYTMDAVCVTNLGVNVGAQKNNDTPFLKAFERCAVLLGDRVCQPWLHINSIYKLLPQGKSLYRSVGICDDFINGIIRERRAEKAGVAIKSKYERSTMPMKSFMEILMEGAGDGGLDDLALRDECTVIAAAGTDTSAVGACFTLNQLARHPSVQEKLFQEVKEIFGDSNRSLTREDLGKLHYTDAVVRESLRLYPPVPVIVRKVEKLVTLPTGHTLVPGTCILIHIWMLHRNPKYWGSDAELFRPERFMDQPLAHPAAFIPFSYGPRNCLGYQYAMMSMKTVVAHVVRRYRILPAPTKLDPKTPQHEPADPNANEEEKPMRLKFDIMMKDVHNFPLELEVRNC